MRRVEFLNHFDAGAAVVRDLVNVGTLHQSHTDVSMTQALHGAWLLVAVALELCPVQYAIEEFDMIAGGDKLGGLGMFERWRLSGIVRQSFPTMRCFSVRLSACTDLARRSSR